MIVDESGNVKNTYEYDVWGSVVSETETVENNHKYAGQYHDEDTGLIYLRARYYDPNDRRFTQEDPIRDELNWYAYCSNNPLEYVDPSGLRSKKAADKIIKDNATYIISAAEEFGVNPGILAATIYAEQRLNVNWLDDVTDVIGHMFDTSIGVSQVKVSTALMLEDKGYMEKTEEGIVNGREQVSRWEGIAIKLADDKINIRYAAAYLRYYQDRWESVYPEIDGRTAILATLYNQGEQKQPHSNPISNPFGDFAKENYYHVRELLELE